MGSGDPVSAGRQLSDALERLGRALPGLWAETIRRSRRGFHHRPHRPDEPCPVHGERCTAPKLEYGIHGTDPRPHIRPDIQPDDELADHDPQEEDDG